MTHRIILLLVGLYFLSCNSRPTTKNELFPVDPDKNIEAVVGTWTICQTAKGGTRTIRNVCSKIIFKINGAGQFLSAADQSTIFSWSIKNDSVKFIFVEDDNDSPFSNGKYRIEHSGDESVLSQDDYKIFLGRTDY